MALSGAGTSLHVVSCTLNYAFAFKTGSSPYVTAGLGFANLGSDGASETITLLGVGLGGRHRLGHDHGAIRVEARYDRAKPEQPSDPVNVVGVRVGFDLDLN